jgi:polyhydroxyalkanoate synthesis regulator phasin
MMKKYSSVMQMVRDMTKEGSFDSVGGDKFADQLEKQIEKKHLKAKKKVKSKLDQIKLLIKEVEDLLPYV